MKHTHIEIDAGAKEPFTLLQISDTHLHLADERDDKTIRVLAEKRKAVYTHSDNYLIEAEKFAKSLGVTIVNTGDLIDFVSYANLDRIRQFTEENDVIHLVGNHDFREGGGMNFDVPQSRVRTIGRVSEILGEDLRFSAHVRNGVDLVFADNAYYRVEQWELDRLEEEIARGLPILLFMHAPIFDVGFHIEIQKSKFRVYSSMFGTPESVLETYPPERYEQQKPDEVTERFIERVLTCPQIRAVVAGHTHMEGFQMLRGKLPQYVTGVDELRELHIH